LVSAAAFTTEDAMGRPQIITSPSGEELVVLSLHDYEELVDALAMYRIDAAFAAGCEELLSAEEASALFAAPAPLAFWRKKRGKTQSQLAAETGIPTSYRCSIRGGVPTRPRWWNGCEEARRHMASAVT
jgi:PHD/YefM family antitoxin component YafN of YafNO toxin-antitoxin module